MQPIEKQITTEYTEITEKKKYQCLQWIIKSVPSVKSVVPVFEQVLSAVHRAAAHSVAALPLYGIYE